MAEYRTRDGRMQQESSWPFLIDCFKSQFTLMHVFSNKKKAPPFVFSFFLGLWVVWWGCTLGYFDASTWVLPVQPPTQEDFTDPDLWTRVFLHWWYPVGFGRSCLIGAVLLILG